MTARRVVTTFGALALGLAAIGLVPALAQSGGAGATGASPNTGMTGTTMGSGTTGMPGGQSTGAAGMTGHAPPASGATPGQMGSSTGMGGGGPGGAAMGRQTTGMTGPHPKVSETYRRTHAGQSRSSIRRGMGGDAQSAEVDRLNEESLQAARNNQRFIPQALR